MTKSHTDIKLHGVIKFLPARLQPYAVLARLDRPVGIWLLAIPGWWSIVVAGGGLPDMLPHDWWIFFLFGIGAVVMRAAGCVVNDLWDRDLDKKVARTKARPLASGEISPRNAAIFLAGLLLLGLIILLQMNTLTIILGFLSLPLIVAYPLMKRFTWWPQLFLGLTFNFGALMGWTAVFGTLSMTAFILYAAGICWTLAYDTIYAHQDKEDDALVGVKSTARLFGQNSKKYVAGFFAAMWLLHAWVFSPFAMVDYLGAPYLLFLFLPLVHIGWQLKSWTPDDSESSLQIFRANVILGLLFLLGLAV